MITKAWEEEKEGSRMYRVFKKITYCRIALLKWRNKVNCSTKVKIKEIQELIERYRNSEDKDMRKKVRDLKLQVKEAYSEEELFWS